MSKSKSTDPLIGQRAPELTLPDQDGKPFTLPVGERPMALFFYPHASTFGCTRELGAVRDAKETNETFLRHPRLAVIGISPDAPEKNHAFAHKEHYTFPLLSDQDGEAREAYGVQKGKLGMGPQRKTVFIDANGVVRNVLVAALDFFAHTTFVEAELHKLEKEAGPGHVHGHGHAHEHAHTQEHGHAHEHAHEHEHAHAHAHGGAVPVAHGAHHANAEGHGLTHTASAPAGQHI